MVHVGFSGSQAKYSGVQLAYPEVSNSDLNYYLHERQVSNIRLQLFKNYSWLDEHKVFPNGALNTCFSRPHFSCEPSLTLVHTE